jgi:hypothetical protein
MELVAKELEYRSSKIKAQECSKIQMGKYKQHM